MLFWSVNMAIKAVFGVLSILIGLLASVAGWAFTYYPWLERNDGSYTSISSAHHSCSIDLVALLAAEDCSWLESMVTMGNGILFFGVLFFILGFIAAIIPSKTKQPESERTSITTTQKWGANCPNCDAVNYGTIQHMQVTIDCGKCSVPFTPSSLEKM